MSRIFDQDHYANCWDCVKLNHIYKARPTNINPLSTNLIKLSNTLKQLVGQQLTNYFSVFDHFVGLALKGLTSSFTIKV